MRRKELPIVVTYEDRPEAFVGVELLARSLQQAAPELELQVYSPSAELGARLAGLESVTWIRTDDLVGRGWDVKPVILQRALVRASRALWLDSDVVVTGDPVGILGRYSTDTIVVGEDLHGIPGSAGWQRAAGTGQPVFRVLPHAVNSGTLLVSRTHSPLLAAWAARLDEPVYQAAQRRPRDQRSVAYDGDQSVLWALLIAPEFCDVPVEAFRRGRELLLPNGANGYHLKDRLRVVTGGQPAFVHMVDPIKPWHFDKVPSSRNALVHLIAYEVSPYFRIARPFAAAVGYPVWLRRRTLPGRILGALSFGNATLGGLPLSLAATLGAALRGVDMSAIAPKRRGVASYPVRRSERPGLSPR